MTSSDRSHPAICLFATLVLAKALMLADHRLVISVWSPFAYFWQDAFAALSLWIVSVAVPWRPASWMAYSAGVLLAAIDVPVAHVLSSPLTWTMIRAARGALADSIAHEATARNLASLAIVLGAGAALPVGVARIRLRAGIGAALAGAAFIAAGVFAQARVDTGGWERNAIGALWPATSASAVAGIAPGDWRASPFPSAPVEDLSALAGTARGKNVVVIVLESTAAQYLMPFGAKRDPTPNLTALARQGLVFDNAYAVYPESIKGLFATLCSREPVVDTAPEILASLPCASIASILSRAGYRTGLFHSGRFAYLGMQAIIDHRGFQTLEDAGAIGGNVHSSFGVDEPATVDRILRWIDESRSGQPFFAMYLPVAGHHPYSTAKPGPFAVTSEQDQYLNALHEGDEAVGRLLAGLRERQLDSRTLFVVFGDHGEAFGQHDGNSGHSLFIYDENVRVPMLIAPIASTDAHVRRAVSVMDVAPTMLDLLGLPREALHDGRSMLDSSSRMALFFTDYSRHWVGLRDGCWKYILETNSRRSKLFDVCADPGETIDRSTEHTDRVAAYSQRLDLWLAHGRDAVRQGVPVLSPR